MTFIFPLSGIVGMIKKNVRNRIPVLRINWATFPHVPQQRDSAISSDPQKNTFVPMINIAAVRITRVRNYRHLYLSGSMNKGCPMATIGGGVL